MLFTVGNDDYILDDYFNMGNQVTTSGSNNVLSPKEGLTLGNLFHDEYDEYKNYKPKRISTSSKEGEDLLRIRELTFAIIDLNLKLDVEPNNRDLYILFKKYTEELNKLVKDYSEKYNPLELCDANIKDNYIWYKSPWPWEGDANV